MDEATINAVFQLKPSRQETKADATTRAAREIIDSEAIAREAKTERLRAARLAQETTARPAKVRGKARSKG
jgi:hypothetical protein